MASVEKVYARALMDFVNNKTNLSRVLEEIEDFFSTCKDSPELNSLLLQNNLNADKRKTVVEAIVKKMKLSDQAQKFLLLLAERGRLSVLLEISKKTKDFIDAASGIARGKIITAVKLPSGEIHELEATIGKQLGKKIELNQTEDPTLLGGVVVQVAGKTFDASLRTQLNKLRTQIMQ